MGLCDRLEALGKPPKGRWYRPAGAGLLAASGGELLGGFWMFTASDLDWVLPAFFGSVVLLAAFGGVLLHAAKSVAEQRDDSITRVHKELKALLDEFEEPGAVSHLAPETHPKLVREVERIYETPGDPAKGSANAAS